jgi:hypothetical protein
MRSLLFSLLLTILLLMAPCGDRAAAGPVVAGVSGPAPAVAAAQAEIATIESYTSGLDRYIKRNAQRARYFADTSSYEVQNAPPRWQEFKTRRALDKAWQDGQTYKSSNVWFNPSGELVVALFTLSSPSGDWAQYVTNYYRSDGTLAKSTSELRTFMGNLVVIRNRFYDSGGKMIRERTRHLDLKTRRPKQVKPGDYMDMEAPLYARTTDLPFNNLLKKR